MEIIARAFSAFFFSSRRRHTRCSRDWSSDVCSSDLVCIATGTRVFGMHPVRQGRVMHLDYEQGRRLTRTRYQRLAAALGDRKSTRLNSSHGYISYAVVCLKKKKRNIYQ